MDRVSGTHTLGVGLPLAGLVSSYLRRLAAATPAMSAAERGAAEEPTVALARALLTAASDIQNNADHMGDALDVRVLEYLTLHLRDRDLSATRIAAAHGISERHLYTVLARNGISLRTWLRGERLKAAARTLSGPAGPNLTIAAIAHHWGFADHAHFTREFRQHYGMTPTEWRVSPGPRRG